MHLYINRRDRGGIEYVHAQNMARNAAEQTKGTLSLLQTTKQHSSCHRKENQVYSLPFLVVSSLVMTDRSPHTLAIKKKHRRLEADAQGEYLQTKASRSIQPPCL
jgi:hypothetical protein